MSFEWIAFRRLAYNPAEGIDEQKILGCISEFLIAMTHIEIYHAVATVAPYHREISVADDILQAYRVVR